MAWHAGDPGFNLQNHRKKQNNSNSQKQPPKGTPLPFRQASSGRPSWARLDPPSWCQCWEVGRVTPSLSRDTEGPQPHSHRPARGSPPQWSALPASASPEEGLAGQTQQAAPLCPPLSSLPGQRLCQRRWGRTGLQGRPGARGPWPLHPTCVNGLPSQSLSKGLVAWASEMRQGS